MLYQPLNTLIEKAGSRYLLVTSVAQRARKLQSDPDKLNGEKPVTKAVEELMEDELTITPREQQPRA